MFDGNGCFCLARHKILISSDPKQEGRTHAEARWTLFLRQEKLRESWRGTSGCQNAMESCRRNKRMSVVLVRAPERPVPDPRGIEGSKVRWPLRERRPLQGSQVHSICPPQHSEIASRSWKMEMGQKNVNCSMDLRSHELADNWGAWGGLQGPGTSDTLGNRTPDANGSLRGTGYLTFWLPYLLQACIPMVMTVLAVFRLS